VSDVHTEARSCILVFNKEEMFLTNKIEWVTANYLFKFIGSSRNDKKMIKRKLFYWREMGFFLWASLSPWTSDMPDGLDFAENLHKFTQHTCVSIHV
jgi:hypothetical protein